MVLRKLQLAGGPPGRAEHATTTEYGAGAEHTVGLGRLAALRALGWDGSGAGRADASGSESGRGALLYGAVALGLVTGAAISAYLWKQRTRALNLLQATPLDRAEELLASCENKIADIERAIDELKNASR